MAESGQSGSRKKERFSEDMIRECLTVMESGDIEDLFEIIPRIGVLRDPRFKDPLLSFLQHDDLRRREFAAYSMGAIGDRSFLDPLKKAFRKAAHLKGSGARELQIAIIEAIGSIGDDAAVEFFLPALKTCCDEKVKSTTGKKSSTGIAGKMSHWIIESLGAIAQQGGERSLEALVELSSHHDPEVKALAISELSVAYWHRPNEIDDTILRKIYASTMSRNPLVADSALSALQNLADVGCRRAEAFFSSVEEKES
ncbi:MAG TPA: HEAT repeat domain-containing protein [Acidobacteriota bacterium]|nr:HEAT repeat domain-containing protein [Acidobacteriota bacterium]